MIKSPKVSKKTLALVLSALIAILSVVTGVNPTAGDFAIFG